MIIIFYKHVPSHTTIKSVCSSHVFLSWGVRRQTHLWVLSFKTSQEVGWADPPCSLLPRGDHTGATLRTNPSFVPNNLNCSFRWVLRLDAFCLPSSVRVREANLHLLCSVHTWACNVECTVPSEAVVCLFVWGRAQLERFCPRRTCEFISQAYKWGDATLCLWYWSEINTTSHTCASLK